MDRRKKMQMMRAFNAFTTRISQRYDDVAQALLDEDYERAMELLIALGRSHAKTSLSLRNALVRDGKLENK